MTSSEYGSDLLVAFLSVLVEVASKARRCGYEAETGRGNMIASCDMENFYEKHCPRNRILNFGPDTVARGKGVFNLSDLMWGTYSNLETKISTKSYPFHTKRSIADIWSQFAIRKRWFTHLDGA